MEAFLDCMPCILRQGLQSARLSSSDERQHREIMAKLLVELSKADPSATPVALGLIAQNVSQEVTGCRDAYTAIRERSNQEALRLYPRLKAIVEAADDRLLTAAKLAIAGNIIDFGALGEDFDVEATISRVLESPLNVDHYAQFSERARAAGKVLYLADNAGEIVFDRLLIEELSDKEVTVAVRNRPFINDATLADAEAVGLTDVAHVIGAPIHPETSPELEDAWRSAGLIVSKGQANYESYSEAEGPIFFLLIAKCDFIASDIGANKGDIILKAR
jgi:uncharacterized protein with ATP-grasp and redox domains